MTRETGRVSCGTTKRDEPAPPKDRYTTDYFAERTDWSLEDVEAEFHRKHRFVRYLHREELDDFDALFDFLADLRTNEAATVERARRDGGTG